MKSLKTILGIALSVGGLGTAATVTGVSIAQGNKVVVDSAVEAATATTVYYAISSSDVGTYTLKCNVNRKGDGDDWATYSMSRDGTKTYNGKDIYKATFTDLYDGLGVLQFQLYDGDTWISQEQPISGWTKVSTYNNKLKEYGVEGWKTYDYDVKRTVYLNVYDWGSLLVHYWNTGLSDTSWPGTSVAFTDSNLRFNGNNNKLQAYTITALSTSSPKFLYQSAADVDKSSDFNVTDGSYYWHNGSAWVEETGDLAKAAAYVWDFNTARLAVGASGRIKQYSICGLDLSSWYSRYTSLPANAKTKVREASIWTYKDSTSTGADTRVSFADIIDYMADKVGSGSRQPSLIDNKNNTIIITAVSVTLGLIASTGIVLYALKKRKQQF